MDGRWQEDRDDDAPDPDDVDDAEEEAEQTAAMELMQSSPERPLNLILLPFGRFGFIFNAL